ncbi:carbohydrate ABC transporter permease [Puerhibacterium puerhi]|uniref:carbohydrate ABC transporter permease n=1 Tax=Puerhibacterium puerhi TaxID=2692623 RepID=UPI00135A24CC|nr:sugar ABC transporter permease [Puerhibacterium puerhi]
MTTTATLEGRDVAARGDGRGGDHHGDRARRRARAREKAAQWLFLAPAIVYVLVFFGYPVVKNLTMGFQEYTTRTFYTGEAPWVGFANYAEVFRSSIFGTTVVNTVLFTVGSIVGQFVLGLLLALYFKRRFPLSNMMRSLLLLPWLLPVIAGTSVWKWMLDQDSGVLNQVLRGLHLVSDPVPWLTSPDVALLGVVIVNVWLGIPFNSALLYSGLQDIPDELYEAGALDGATGWKAFWHITWPNLRGVVNVVLVLGVIYTLKVLDIILGLTGGGPANATQTLATDSYRRSFTEFSFGTGAAVSNVLIVVSLVFAVVYLRVNRRAVDE